MLINVKDAPFRAKGDGLTDDHSAVQAALDAAEDGDRVFLPTGRYAVSGTLTCSDKSIALCGESISDTEIYLTAETQSLLAWRAARDGAVRLSTLTLHGNSLATSDVALFQGQFNHQSRVEDVRVRGATDRAVNIDGAFTSAGFDNLFPRCRVS